MIEACSKININYMKIDDLYFGFKNHSFGENKKKYWLTVNYDLNKAWKYKQFEVINICPHNLLQSK